MATTAIDIRPENTPVGFEGAGFFATKLDAAVGLARKNSLWPLPFATSCCGINLWQPWQLPTIYRVLAWNALVFRLDKPIY